MKDFLLVFCVFVLFLKNCAFCVFIRDEEPSTKPPLQVEALPWLTFFDQKSSSDGFGKSGRTNQRDTINSFSFNNLCPPGETGQFPYPPDCKKFINCWKGRGSVQPCAPGTLFNPETSKCDYPGNVKCDSPDNPFWDQKTMSTGERYVRFPQQRPQILHNQRIARRNQNEQSKPDSVPARPYPGRPPYFGPSHLLPPTRPGNSTQGREVRPQCALGMNGIYPHPYDCSKFLKCWSGNTIIQNCGPGTLFNPLISTCDHPRNVPCAHEGTYPTEPAVQPEQPDKLEIPVDDLYIPEESVQYEQYQSLGVKAPRQKGEKKTVKQDPDSPNYEFEPPVGSSTPKTEAEDLELPVVSQTQPDSSHRKPKVINTGSALQNQFASPHGKEPATYLTPPQYDVYGNLIASDNNDQAKLGVQPNKPKVQTQNPSAYPSNPYLISYPPQGPYSAPHPGNQLKFESPDQTKHYLGYSLNKKHPQHPLHPHQFQHPVHPHHPIHPVHPHMGPPTWLAPPPFQAQFFPHHPNHPFSPKADSTFPHTPFHVMHLPYYPGYISEEDFCSKFAGKNKKDSSAPKCDTPVQGTPDNQGSKPFLQSSWYNPAIYPYLIPSGTGQTQGSSNVHPGFYPQQPGKLNSQFQSSFNKPPTGDQNINAQGHSVVPSGFLPPTGNVPGSGYSPQFQVNPTLNSPKLPTKSEHPSTDHQHPNSPTQGSFHKPNPPRKPSFNEPAYPTAPQLPTYSKQQENSDLNPHYPTGSSYTPVVGNQNPSSNIPQQSSGNKPDSQQTAQYLPYLFYYYPVNSNLYSYQPGAYYPGQYFNPPKQFQTPNHPQVSKTDSAQGQIPVSDPFPTKDGNSSPQYNPSAPSYVNPNRGPTPQASAGPVEVSDPYDNYGVFSTAGKNPSPEPEPPVYGDSHRESPQQGGQVEVPDPFGNKNYVFTPSSTTTRPQYDPTAPIYVNPYRGSWQRPQGQTQEPSPFDHKNHIPKENFYPVREKDNIHGTPYYPQYNPQDSSGPPHSSNIKSTEPYPEDTATFPPFPGSSQEKPQPGKKTGIKSKVEPKKEYLLGKIDVRTREEEEDLEDAENIPTTQPPIKKKGSEKVDETVFKKPSYTHPDKYSEPEKGKTGEKTTEDAKLPEQSTRKFQPESDITFSEPKKPKKPKPYVKVKQTPPNGQIVRLRNGASHLDGYLEMKDSKSKWGLVCDSSGQWSIAEATVACRELGFIRGAELSWQGYPIKSDAEDLHVAVSRINCTGTETSLSECKRILDDKDQCDVGRNAVGLRCFDNLASHCQPGEILYNQHCYKLHGKENPDDPWIKTEEASEECKKHGGKLVDITSQYENDFLSEWLIKKHPDVTAVATGGIGISVLGRPMWLWEGTSDPMVYERWWSGWSGDQNIPKGSIDGPLCIVLRKTFSCVDNDDQKNLDLANDEETCSADYFFWDVEDCGELRTSVFICERPMDDIGCVVGNGEGYVGTANTTASGLPCLPWDHPKVVEGLARRGTVQERSSRLTGHNYCRNLGSPDRHPWCFVEGRGNSEYCAIPQCWDSGKD